MSPSLFCRTVVAGTESTHGSQIVSRKQTEPPKIFPRHVKIQNSKLVHTHSRRNVFLYDILYVATFQRTLWLGVCVLTHFFIYFG